MTRASQPPVGRSTTPEEEFVREVLERYQVACRTSDRALAEVQTDLDEVRARDNLSPGAVFVLDLTDALIGTRLRRAGAREAVAAALAGFAESPLAADPWLAQQAAMGAVVLVQPERIRGLARATLARTDLDDALRARVLYLVGLADSWSGDLVRGQLGLHEARDLARRNDAHAMQAELTCLLAKVEALRGELDAAQAHLDEGRRLGADAGSEWVAGGYLECSLALHLSSGDEEAYLAVLEALVAGGAGLDSGLFAEYRWELATARALAGDHARARTVLDESPLVPPDLSGAASLDAWRAWILDPDDPGRAAALEAAADALNRPAERLLAARLAWLTGCRHAAAGRRGDAIRMLEVAARRYTAMGALGPLARVDDELRRLHPRRASGRDSAVRHGFAEVATLTEAERRVAIAVSGGLSNREVADALFLSVRTVESHLAAVFRKLRVRNRTELALRR